MISRHVPSGACHAARPFICFAKIASSAARDG